MLSVRGYDLCIIGSGIAGAMLANVAARRGQTVLVVEAGKKFERGRRIEQIQHRQILGTPLWPWVVPGRDGYVDRSNDSLGHAYTLNNSRIKGVGGTTLHWGGLVNRFWPSDFESRSRWRIGDDWPISYEDLEPYYTIAEAEMGVSGRHNPLDPQRSRPHPMEAFPPRFSERVWVDIAENLGVSLDWPSHARNSRPYNNRPACSAFAQCNACPIGARYSADFHIESALASGTVDLVTQTVARRIELGSDNAVSKIRATTVSGEELEFTADNFVIAAHAIESARLLLLSNIANTSDQVGRNLMEHWYAGAGGIVDDQVFPGRIGFTTLESSHWYDSPDRTNRGAIKIEFMDFRDDLANGIGDGLSGADLAAYDCKKFGHWVGVAAEIEHQPNQQSRVTLDPELVDMFGDPLPRIRFEISDIDRATMKRAREIIRMFLDARGCRDVQTSHDYSPAHHHMGTCRMGDDAEISVVDRNCNVHEISNLFVAGSSVFPTGGAHQPTLTIAALALRLADYLYPNP